MSAPVLDRAERQATATGALLLHEVRAYIARFCRLPSPEALDAVTLWVAHTHTVDSAGVIAFATTPRLALLSDGPASGKTRLLDILARLSRRGEVVANPSAPGLVTMINSHGMTPFIDEVDLLLTGGAAAQRDTRTILNSGYRMGAKIARASRMASCFAPIALAGMGATFKHADSLAATRSRSLIVNMRPASGAVEGFRERVHAGEAGQLRLALETFYGRHAGAAATAWPDLPEGVVDRQADIWEPLFIVADIAGGDWPERVRRACELLSLSAGDDDADDVGATPLITLCRDIVTVMFGEPKIFTADLMGRLAALDGQVHRFKQDRASSMALAKMLEPVGIGPVKVDIGGKVLQGYTLRSFVYTDRDEAGEIVDQWEAVPGLLAIAAGAEERAVVNDALSADLF